MITGEMFGLAEDRFLFLFLFTCSRSKPSGELARTSEPLDLPGFFSDWSWEGGEEGCSPRSDGETLCSKDSFARLNMPPEVPLLPFRGKRGLGSSGVDEPECSCFVAEEEGAVRSSSELKIFPARCSFLSSFSRCLARERFRMAASGRKGPEKEWLEWLDVR